MSIAFFYPLAWLGGLAIFVPIWLHLRRREDPRLVRFSALQFLEDQPAARRRNLLWPQNWPLLLLRLLGLLLLVAAFSWPYLSSPEEIVVDVSRVYILDNTLSHQAHGGFENRRDEIIDQLQESGLETQIAVVELTDQPRVLVSFGDRQEAAIDRLKKRQASHQRGSYLAAFRLADRLLRQSVGAQRQIVLLGDSQQNQWSEGRSIPPFLENTDVTLPKVVAGDVANVALMEPIVSWDFGGQQPTMKCAVTLYHQGKTETAQVVHSVNGEEFLRRDVTLSEQPESLTLVAEWEADPTEWVTGQIRVDHAADVLPSDNQVVFSVPPVRGGRLGLLAQSPFLQTALSPDVMRGRWTTRVLSLSELPLAQQENSELDVLCVTAEFLESSKVRELVLGFLDSGRGVFLVIDRVNPTISGFLRRLDIQCLPVLPRSSLSENQASDPGAPSVRVASTGIRIGTKSLSENPKTPTPNPSPEDGGGGFRIGTKSNNLRYVFLEHPIFRPFKSADFGNLTEISVTRYRRLKMPHALPLVFSGAGDPLLLESQRTDGRLLVLAFALSREETDWPLHPTFIPFLDRCLQRLRAEITISTEYRPGGSCIWRIPGGREVHEIVLRSADRRDADTNIRAVVDDGQARFEVPGTPGLYSLRYDDGSTVEGLLAVNPAPLESRLRYSESPNVVEEWTRPSVESDKSGEPTEFTTSLSQASILRQRVWWWLALAGLVALVTETVCLTMKKGPT